MITKEPYEIAQPTQHRVKVFGSNILQNKLLTLYLEEATGVTCTWSSTLELDNLDVTLDVTGVETGESLVLIDCYKTDLPRLWSHIDFGRHSSGHCIFLLFNVNTEQGLEKEALERGIRGVFYEDDALETFVKGVLAIIKGQLWYSRETLSKCLLEQKKWEKISKSSLDVTPREKEILIKIATGASNKEIASTLCISTHTVKSHVYNIYKKINVPNRLQAILWTLKHL